MKIIPKVRTDAGVEICTLKEGDTFLVNGGLYILVYNDPAAVELATGKYREFNDETIVQKVDCTLKWQVPKKKSTTKKK